ncbi:MAG: aminopeptidase P family protein [Bacteroidales bacterium]|nr:aminopeptidase P family protein [Bacteroidales bacterium]
MFQSSVYANRRNALRSGMSSGLVLIPGNNDSPMNYPANTFTFRQDSNFLYFFGLDHPGYFGVMDIDTGKDYIFGEDVDIDDIIWMGPQDSLAEKALFAGVEFTGKVSEGMDFMKQAIALGRKIHFTPPYRFDNLLFLERILGLNHAWIKSYASVELIKGIVRLREVKEDVEILELEKAAAIGYLMHTTAMRMAKPGVVEREIAGTMEGIALAAGGGVSFPVILSVNGETLHNHYHGNTLTADRLLLCDAGAETASHYASDYTRTFPVSGKFSTKQREIYEIVLAANNKAAEMAAPGIAYQQVHLAAARVIAQGLTDLGLMKGNVDEAVKAGAHAMFFPHGLGHMMGLDVHDMEDMGENFVGYDNEIQRINQFGTAYLRLGKKLKPGFVLTNEPGIYFIPALIQKWEAEKINSEFIDFQKVKQYLGFGGIRLEDDLLITQQGNQLIGNRIPITVEEIERFMA